MSRVGKGRRATGPRARLLKIQVDVLGAEAESELERLALHRAQGPTWKDRCSARAHAGGSFWRMPTPNSLAQLPEAWPDMAMRSVKIAELKDHLSEHLRAVEAGAEIEVTDRNRPVARIIPMSRPFASIRDRRCKPARWPTSSLALLLEERREP